MSTDLRKKIIFLGTPAVAANVLKIIHEKTSRYARIIAVISQPPKRSKRDALPQETPVHSCAHSLGIPVLTPDSAKDPKFLEDFRSLAPDLCITAAYGQFLPQAFLDIPKFGTLNIHPSLLPKYRGASPVQRALEAGEEVSGVTVLFSTLKMDAGPIVAQKEYSVDPNIKCSEMLDTLFEMGALLLVNQLPFVFSGALQVKEQDEQQATHAKKITGEESLLDFSQSALACHNKVRAFNIWPGTKAIFVINEQQTEIKIITTEVKDAYQDLKKYEISTHAQTIDVCCGDKKVLRINELQLPGKRITKASDFINGLRGGSLKLG